MGLPCAGFPAGCCCCLPGAAAAAAAAAGLAAAASTAAACLPHSPSAATLTPAHPAAQAEPQVLLSAPHTGVYTRGQEHSGPGRLGLGAPVLV